MRLPTPGARPTSRLSIPNLYPPVDGHRQLDTMTTPQGWLNRASDDSQWLFDAVRLVLSHRQRNGWVYQFSYSNGRLTQVRQQLRPQPAVRLRRTRPPEQCHSPDGTVIRYTFDSASRLIGAAYADNSSKATFTRTPVGRRP